MFIFSTKNWKKRHFDEYFSDGLVQPPTRKKHEQKSGSFGAFWRVTIATRLSVEPNDPMDFWSVWFFKGETSGRSLFVNLCDLCDFILFIFLPWVVRTNWEEKSERCGRDEIEKCILISIYDNWTHCFFLKTNHVIFSVFCCSTTFPSQSRSQHVQGSTRTACETRFWDVNLFSAKSLLAANPPR